MPRTTKVNTMNRKVKELLIPTRKERKVTYELMTKYKKIGAKWTLLRKPAAILPYMKDDELIIGVDLTLKDIFPIVDYTNLFTCKIQFDHDITLGDLKIIDAFNKDLTLFSKNNKLIFCGFNIDLKRDSYSIYIYMKNQRIQIEKFLKCRQVEDYTIEFVEDKNWDIYKSVILPDINHLNMIYNMITVDKLRKINLDFTKKYRQTFQLLFEDKEKALECRDMAKNCGYDEAMYEDNSDTVEENELLFKYSHMVFLEITEKVYLEHLNINTTKAIRFAGMYGGEFESCRIG